MPLIAAASEAGTSPASPTAAQLSARPEKARLDEQGRALCEHCALPVPRSRIDPKKAPQYCCPGCETVHALLSGAGLQHYYRYRDQLGETGRPVLGESKRFAEFDTPQFERQHIESTPDGAARTELFLEGVHCAACVWLVERVAKLEPAVVSAQLDMSRGTVELKWDPQKATLSRVAQTFDRLGYRPRPYRSRESEKLRQGELRALLIRIAVAGASCGNVMLMAFAMYSDSAGGQLGASMDPATRRFFELLSWGISLPALWAGSLFFKGAWASLRLWTPHMDLPISLGIFVAYLAGSVAAFSGTGHLYFDSITALVFLLLIGRYLQRRHQNATTGAAELLDTVLPAWATLRVGDEENEVATELIVAGDELVVKSGEVIPVDATVLAGTSSLDKSLLSGESKPLSVSAGDQLEAGALNLGATLIIRCTEPAAGTRVARLMQQVETALSSRTPLVLLADRWAGVFTVLVVALASAVGGYYFLVSPQLAVERSVALLIVACPCALGLATPLAMSSAVRQALAEKQLIFSPSSLEAMAGPCTLVFDKTGTLTEGKLAVRAYYGDARFLRAVLSCERSATHPVAAALVSYCREQAAIGSQAAPGAQLSEVQHELGSGVRAQWQGKSFAVGSAAFVLPERTIPADLARELATLRTACSPILVGFGDQVVGLFWVGDAMRDEAADALSELKANGHEIMLLSGDYPGTVDGFAAELCERAADPQLFCQVFGGQSPEGKLAKIRSLQDARTQPNGAGPAGVRKRAVVMVGDGVNDAAALAAADVGVSVQRAAEASRLSADIYLSKSGVGEVVRLLQAARGARTTIVAGLAFSLVYNLLGVSLAIVGLLGPLGAAVLMPLSSVTVVVNAYRHRIYPQPRAGRSELRKPARRLGVA